MQVHFINKIHFLKFVSINDKSRLYQLKVITSTCSTVEASLTGSIFPTVWRNTSRKEKYTLLKTNTKSHQLIKHTKISSSTASLVFHIFSCDSYQSSLNQDTSKLRYFQYLKKYGPCLFDTFCGKSTFYYTLSQDEPPKKFIYNSKETGHQFPR